MVNRVYTVVYSFSCRIFTLPLPDRERLGREGIRGTRKRIKASVSRRKSANR
jgi:hypothetical protein